MANIATIDKSLSKSASLLHKKCFDDYWLEQDFIELLSLPTNFAWGYYCHNILAGLILLTITQHEGEILTLCTHPEYRIQGIAKNLLNYIIAYLYKRNISSLFLEVSMRNLNAITLYKSLNFKEIAIRKNYYGTDEDAIVMKFKFCYNK